MDSILQLLGACFPCFPDLSIPSVWINNDKYKIIKLLGEGGFSYVYLVHGSYSAAGATTTTTTLHSSSSPSSSSSSSPYALKRINCPFGVQDETYKNAMREIKNYHRFTASKTPYIIQSIDESIVTNPDGLRQINILLPYFERSLQDIINEHVLSNTKMDEGDILRTFIGICRGLEVMHNYKSHKAVTNEINGGNSNISRNEEAEEEEAALLPHDGEEDAVGVEPDSNSNNIDGDDSNGILLLLLLLLPLLLLTKIPYAHHDLKPANVMFSSSGLPVLVDLGSCSKARIHVTTRQQALTVTDFAQEHCTLPYRAPELMDVSTGAKITEATDIWSLGCLLYCCCFGYSPFEKLEIQQGANLIIAIVQGKYEIPEDRAGYSEELVEMIRKCLQVKAEKRPSAAELVEEALDITRMYQRQ